jgi:hypothetical protein
VSKKNQTSSTNFANYLIEVNNIFDPKNSQKVIKYLDLNSIIDKKVDQPEGGYYAYATTINNVLDATIDTHNKEAYYFSDSYTRELNFTNLNSCLKGDKLNSIILYQGGTGSGKTTTIKMYLEYLKTTIDSEFRMIDYYDISHNTKISGNRIKLNQNSLNLIVTKEISNFIANQIQQKKLLGIINFYQDLEVIEEILSEDVTEYDHDLQLFIKGLITKLFLSSVHGQKEFNFSQINSNEFLKIFLNKNLKDRLNEFFPEPNELKSFNLFYDRLLQNISLNNNSVIPFYYFKFLNHLKKTIFASKENMLLFVIDNFDLCDNISMNDLLSISFIMQPYIPMKILFVMRGATWYKHIERNGASVHDNSIEHVDVHPFYVIKKRLTAILNIGGNDSIHQKTVKILDILNEEEPNILSFIRSAVGSNIRKALILAKNWYKIPLDLFDSENVKHFFMTRAFIAYPSGTFNNTPSVYKNPQDTQDEPLINSIFNNDGFKFPLIKLHILVGIYNSFNKKQDYPANLYNLLQKYLKIYYYSKALHDQTDIFNNFITALNSLLNIDFQFLYSNQYCVYISEEIQNEYNENNFEKEFSRHEFYLTKAGKLLFDNILYELSYVGELMVESSISKRFFKKDSYSYGSLYDRLNIMYTFIIYLFFYEINIIVQSKFLGSTTEDIRNILLDKETLISEKIYCEASNSIKIITNSIIRKHDMTSLRCDLMQDLEYINKVKKLNLKILQFQDLYEKTIKPSLIDLLIGKDTELNSIELFNLIKEQLNLL